MRTCSGAAPGYADLIQRHVYSGWACATSSEVESGLAGTCRFFAIRIISLHCYSCGLRPALPPRLATALGFPTLAEMDSLDTFPIEIWGGSQEG
jgi:hypothetical protein